MGAETTPAAQQFALKWNDYQTSMLSSFRLLRESEDFIDVTVACAGKSFPAHKVVLSACSPYFCKLLKSNPCSHPIIILNDVLPRDMDYLLRFMYNGEVYIGEEHLTDFIKTGKMLQIRGLADVAEQRLNKLSPKTGTTTTTPTTTTTGHSNSNLEQRTSTNSLSLPWTTDRSNSPVSKRQRLNTSTDTHQSPSQNNNGEMSDSLLGQALEGGPSITVKEKSNNFPSQSRPQSPCEDSNSSGGSSDHGDGDPTTPKTEPSDYPTMDDTDIYNTNGMPPSYRPMLGMQDGYPCLPFANLLAGPSGMPANSNDFVSRRSMDVLRVRATDPRPCPKCGKIYRSAHTLRTHLEDKHTICPGYRCVLCGTVAKSRNSLHSHMSRQHRGISTKDLPVLPMPAPFDPDMASKLLAKAGVKISAADLRARASPTGPRRSDMKLDAKSAYSGAASEGGSSVCGDNDPEDLTVSQSRYNASSPAIAAKSIDSLQHLSKEPFSSPMVPGSGMSTNSSSSIIDTYLQYMQENGALGIVSPEQAAVAAQMAQYVPYTPMKMEFMEHLSQQITALTKRAEEIRRVKNDMPIRSDRSERENEESSGGTEDDYSDEAEQEGVKSGE